MRYKKIESINSIDIFEFSDLLESVMLPAMAEYWEEVYSEKPILKREV